MFGVEDIVGAVCKIWEAKKVGEHMRLVFGIGFSYVISGTFVAGSSLLAGAGYPRSLGAGLVAAATFGTLSYRRSPLARGTVVALPGAEADEEFKQNAQTISK
jgi:hypothetical protein